MINSGQAPGSAASPDRTMRPPSTRYHIGPGGCGTLDGIRQGAVSATAYVCFPPISDIASFSTVEFAFSFAMHVD